MPLCSIQIPTSQRGNENPALLLGMGHFPSRDHTSTSTWEVSASWFPGVGTLNLEKENVRVSVGEDVLC